MQWSMVLSLCEYYWWGEASLFEAHDVFRRFQQQICMRSGFAFCVSWFFWLGAIVVFGYASLLTRLPIRTFTIQLPWLLPQVPKQRQQKQSLHPRSFANHMWPIHWQFVSTIPTPFCEETETPRASSVFVQCEFLVMQRPHVADTHVSQDQPTCVVLCPISRHCISISRSAAVTEPAGNFECTISRGYVQGSAFASEVAVGQDPGGH